MTVQDKTRENRERGKEGERERRRNGEKERNEEDNNVKRNNK